MKTLLVFLGVICLGIFSGQAQDILTLKSGDTIQGKVSKIGSTYQVEVANVGLIRIPEDQVAHAGTLIGAYRPTAPTNAQSAYPSQLRTVKLQIIVALQRMVRTKGMPFIRQHAQNPALQRILKDPEIEHAILTGDYQQLQHSQNLNILLEYQDTRQMLNLIVQAH